MNFTKMHGTGNDFIVIDDREDLYLNREGEVARILCDRHFGIGGDGVLFVRKSNIAHVAMVIINSDGSYASMCGNGIRCFAKYLWDEGIVKHKHINIETGDGIKVAAIITKNNEAVGIKINMGLPSFKPSEIPALITEDEIINYDINVNSKHYKINSMLMGVPHTVIIGELNCFDTEEGKYIEKNHEIFPQGTNVNFCEVADRNNIKVKTWERGAGATLACGTGCCASVIACHKLGYINNKVNVSIPGGILEIEIKEDGVFMNGPAVIAFRGETELV